MFGIVFGTLCLFALIAVISRERHYRKHGYPAHRHHHGHCGHCHHHCDHPPPSAGSSSEATPAAQTGGAV